MFNYTHKEFIADIYLENSFFSVHFPMGNMKYPCSNFTNQGGLKFEKKLSLQNYWTLPFVHKTAFVSVISTFNKHIHNSLDISDKLHQFPTLFPDNFIKFFVNYFIFQQKNRQLSSLKECCHTIFKMTAPAQHISVATFVQRVLSKK